MCASSCDGEVSWPSQFITAYRPYYLKEVSGGGGKKGRILQTGISEKLAEGEKDC